MNARKPALKWSTSSESYLLLKHRVRRETLEDLMDAKEAWHLEPVTGYRFAAGDPKKGGTT